MTNHANEGEKDSQKRALDMAQECYRKAEAAHKYWTDEAERWEEFAKGAHWNINASLFVTGATHADK